MRIKELFALIRLDAYRYTGTLSLLSLFSLYFRTPGFKYTCKIRFAKFCRTNGLWRCLFPLAYLSYRHCMFKYGIGIPYMTDIGEGFYIGHFGGIIINSNVIIGKNVNLSHGVTIGKNREGCPTIGNEVYIGPNSTIVGKITIGNNVTIGANAFVNKDVIDGLTVGGVPAKMISQGGANDYIHNKV